MAAIARPHRTPAPFHVRFFAAGDVERKRREVEVKAVGRMARNAPGDHLSAVRYMASCRQGSMDERPSDRKKQGSVGNRRREMSVGNSTSDWFVSQKSRAKFLVMASQKAQLSSGISARCDWPP